MASESLICLRSGRLPAASVFQVSVLSAFPAPGVGCISGFRPCLFLRFPTLPTPPVSGVGCFSGFHLVRLCGFQPTCSPVPGVVRFFGFRFVRLCRFSALPAPSAPGVGCFLRFLDLVRLFALTRSSVSSPSALRQLSVSFPSAFRHTTGGAAAQSRKPSFTNCSRMRVQSATGRFTPSTNRIGQPRLLSSM